MQGNRIGKMHIIFVGGFLGAGKTTLLAQAAKHLAAQGKRVGVITNDQAADLVDTKLLAGSGVAVEEIPAGCFCCRFEDLERTAGHMFEKMRPDVLLSEPVGSCMDISATVLQPMKQRWGKWAEIFPFSVLADPRRLRQVFDDANSSFPDSVRYIIKKQFEEADFVVINKTDLITPEELAALKPNIASVWSDAKILEMSALKDHGVVEWLDTILKAPNGGKKILDVDYDIYASGEAELGWLNASIVLTAHEETNWDSFARELIGRIHGELAGRSAEIGHVKLLVSNAAGIIVASATSIGEKARTKGSIGRGGGGAELIINARAHVEPQVLKSIVESSISAVAGNAIGLSEVHLTSFKPAYPRPTHRFGKVVIPA
jgi:G3E family GTPase